MARRRSLPWVRAGLRWDTWPPWPRLPPVVLSRAPARAVLQPAPSTDTGYQASAATLPLRSDYHRSTPGMGRNYTRPPGMLPLDHFGTSGNMYSDH